MGVPGVEARALRGDGYDGFVNEDVRVHRAVWDPTGWQGFQNVQAHHRADVGLLDQSDLALCGVDIDSHDPTLLV
jgi:hypothetical protein